MSLYCFIAAHSGPVKFTISVNISQYECANIGVSDIYVYKYVLVYLVSLIACGYIHSISVHNYIG